MDEKHEGQNNSISNSLAIEFGILENLAKHESLLSNSLANLFTWHPPRPRAYLYARGLDSASLLRAALRDFPRSRGNFLLSFPHDARGLVSIKLPRTVLASRSRTPRVHGLHPGE
jgi:hypothetical protein